MRRSITRKSTRVKALIAGIGVVFALSATACDSVNNAADQVSDAASKAQSAASQASDIANNLPTNGTGVRDKLTERLQTKDLAFNADTCTQTGGDELHATNIDSSWPKGPYMTIAEQSPTRHGDFKPVDPSTFTAVNPHVDADPRVTWHWNCGIPRDHLGWLRFSIVHFDANGKPDTATKWSYVKVLA